MNELLALRKAEPPLCYWILQTPETSEEHESSTQFCKSQLVAFKDHFKTVISENS